jgi:hypothetical protein
MGRGLFGFTDLGGDVSLVEKQPAIGDVLSRCFGPRLRTGGILNGPSHRLRDALM